jgi:hypothetical protein
MSGASASKGYRSAALQALKYLTNYPEEGASKAVIHNRTAPLFLRQRAERYLPLDKASDVFSSTL